jgi:Transglycosylase SLT domain/CHAP domain
VGISSQRAIGALLAGLVVIIVPFLAFVSLLIPQMSQNQGGAGNITCLPSLTEGRTLSSPSALTVRATTPTPGNSNGCVGNQAIVQAAQEIVAHLHGDPDVYWDAGMPQQVINFWESHCPRGSGCWIDWQSGNLQCVQLVTGAYALAGAPLPKASNAIDFWALYAGLAGWSEILSYTTPRHLPLPGDIMVWSGGSIYGHVALVTGVVPPDSGHDGSITITQANGPGSFINGQFVPGVVTQPLAPDLEVRTWPGYQVLGYIRPNSVYVDLAAQYAKAEGLDPTLFIRQIRVESDFNPNAVSTAGAIGIAQFLPSTAANLSPPVDPTDAVASLAAMAHYMATKINTYGGDYAKALSAYNAGDGTVQNAVSTYGTHWLEHMPSETINYVNRILNGS